MDPAHLIREFFAEAQEHVSNAEEDVLSLEQSGIADGREALNRLFRALHTIKGGAACVHFDAIKDLAHEMENVVGRMRDGLLEADPGNMPALLEGVDRMKAAIFSGKGTITDHEGLLSRLRAIAAGNPVVGMDILPGRRGAEPANSAFDLPRFDIAGLRDQGLHVFEIELDAVAECRRGGCTPADLLANVGSVGTVLASLPEADAFTDSPPAFATCTILLSTIIDDADILCPGLRIEPLTCLHHPPPGTSNPAAEPAETSVARGLDSAATPSATPPRGPEKLLRIPVEIADMLMNLAGELVVVRNRSQQLQVGGGSAECSAVNQRLDVVTSDIQRVVMRTRMQPVGNVFGRFSRVVRDLGRDLGKEIELQVAGADVELDKSIIDGLVEPLTHLVRNSVDHGIESPEERRRAGKPAVGRIRLAAEHQAGVVNITVVDDGRGMDPQALREAVVEKGLMSQHQASNLADREAFDLVFLPGFSTAKEVTDISGRGVGMDAVRASLHKLGGVVEIESTIGRGSTISIRLPLTLAIIPAFILSTGGQSFAVPQVSVLEVVWLHGDQVGQSLHAIDDREVYWLRGRMLPLIRLSRILGLGTPEPVHAVGDPVEDSLYIIVLRVGSDRFGLCVEDIVDTEEIVVKPLHERLKASRIYAGATVLGDGTTSMILDVPELARLGGLRCERSEAPVVNNRAARGEQQKMLLFTNGIERFAVPLSILMRVDEIRPGDIQTAAGGEFLRFRDSVIPLLRIESAIPSLDSRYEEGNLHALVPRMENPSAILIGGIVDIVKIDNDSLVLAKGNPAVIGTQVIEGHATTILDLGALVGAQRSIGEADGDVPRESRGRILLVDDSTLHQALIASTLRSRGFDVVVAGDGLEALETLRRESVDGVVSDIEMPGMDGLDLVRRLRADPILAGIPMLAISTTEEKFMRTRAMDAGFDGFSPKSDLPKMGDAILSLVGTARRRAVHA